MAQDYAKQFYGSSQWKKARSLYLSSQFFICEDCGEIASIVHHIKPITPNNINDPNITLNQNNFKAVCEDCHTLIHSGGVKQNGVTFDENGNIAKEANVFLVCGSPASGKSFYVKNRKTKHDIVIDLDYICAALMGELDNIYADHEPVLSVALEVKALLYEVITARRGKWQKAYVVTSIANIAEQKAIAREINAEIVLIDTNIGDCLKNLRADKRRAKVEGLHEELIHKWHREYEASLNATKGIFGAL